MDTRRHAVRCVFVLLRTLVLFFFFQAEDGIRDVAVTGVQTCALPICAREKSLPVLQRGYDRQTVSFSNKTDMACGMVRRTKRSGGHNPFAVEHARKDRKSVV